MISLLLASCTVCVRSQGGALAGPIADTMWTRVAMRVAHDVPLAHFDAQCTSVRPGGCVRVVCACLRVRPGIARQQNNFARLPDSHHSHV